MLVPLSFQRRRDLILMILTESIIYLILAVAWPAIWPCSGRDMLHNHSRGHQTKIEANSFSWTIGHQTKIEATQLEIKKITTIEKFNNSKSLFIQSLPESPPRAKIKTNGQYRLIAYKCKSLIQWNGLSIMMLQITKYIFTRGI